MQAIERNVESLDWVSLSFFTAFLLLALAKSLYPQRFEDFISLLTSNKFMVFRGKDYKAFHPFNTLLFLVRVIAISLLIFLILEHFWRPTGLEEPAVIFIRIITAYSSFVLVKFGIEKIVANIFNLDEKIENYLYQKLSYRNFAGLLLLLPLLLFFYTFSPSNALLLGILALFIFINILSLGVIYKQNQNLISANWFYFILYLCALEIAPYFILYKLFTI